MGMYVDHGKVGVVQAGKDGGRVGTVLSWNVYPTPDWVRFVAIHYGIAEVQASIPADIRGTFVGFKEVNYNVRFRSVVVGSLEEARSLQSRVRSALLLGPNRHLSRIVRVDGGYYVRFHAIYATTVSWQGYRHFSEVMHRYGFSTLDIGGNPPNASYFKDYPDGTHALFSWRGNPFHS